VITGYRAEIDPRMLGYQLAIVPQAAPGQLARIPELAARSPRSANAIESPARIASTSVFLRSIDGRRTARRFLVSATDDVADHPSPIPADPPLDRPGPKI
jgi:hypothetical protein